MGYKNIVLTGIMGCGKTTVGGIVAGKLNMKFLDMDHYIQSRWGSIPVLFQKGEEYFRDIESKAVAEIAEAEGQVIATGGGVIKREENITLLKKKGLIFFIDRPLEEILSDIQTTDRPLLKDGKNELVEIFRQRYSLYLHFCDIHIRDAKYLQDVIDTILNCWENEKNRKVQR